MMPGCSCSGVKLTEDSVPAVSHGTLRRITSLTNSEGLPYGRSTTPGPSIFDQSGSAGGAASSARATRPPINAPPAAAALNRNRRRPDPETDSRVSSRHPAGNVILGLHLVFLDSIK